jgi:hypothetical protein
LCEIFLKRNQEKKSGLRSRAKSYRVDTRLTENNRKQKKQKEGISSLFVYINSRATLTDDRHGGWCATLTDDRPTGWRG